MTRDRLATVEELRARLVLLDEVLGEEYRAGVEEYGGAVLLAWPDVDHLAVTA